MFFFALYDINILMLKDSKYRGIFGIPATPFNEDESLDLYSLEKVLDFTLNNGCHGIVMPVMASEYQSLTDEEKKIIFKTTAKIVDNKLPTVAGVTGVSDVHSIELAKYAEDIGFDSVITMPPHSMPPSQYQVKKFFSKINDSINIPIWIQNHPKGHPLSADQLIELCNSFENISLIKEETAYSGQMITNLIRGDLEKNIKSIMGGMGCMHLISEYARGATGNMPASHYGDILSKIWSLLDSGDEKQAIEIHNRMIPLINFEMIYGAPAFKEILVERKIIRSATTRSPGFRSFDKYDFTELKKLMKTIDDLFD